jgi:hypothetical protein
MQRALTSNSAARWFGGGKRARVARRPAEERLRRYEGPRPWLQVLFGLASPLAVTSRVVGRIDVRKTERPDRAHLSDVLTRLRPVKMWLSAR